MLEHPNQQKNKLIICSRISKGDHAYRYATINASSPAAAKRIVSRGNNEWNRRSGKKLGTTTHVHEVREIKKKRRANNNPFGMSSFKMPNFRS